MEKSCYNQPMLSRDFQKLIEVDTVAAARALLGMQLILNGQKLGRIVETEAYLGSQDSQSRTDSSFGATGWPNYS